MFISEAYAQAAGAAQAEPTFISFLPLIGIVVIFLADPSAGQARQGTKKVMRDTLQKGDEIIIGGGKLGGS